ncbi:hypothetical protein D3C84_1064860 [compost metagenome]
MDNGLLRPADPLLLSHALSALLMLGNRPQQAEPAPSTEVLAKTIIDLFWHGVAPER